MLDQKMIPLVIRSIVKFIRTHAVTAGCEALVVDLDGSLNSAVTMALCRQSQLKVVGVETGPHGMKSFAQSMGTYIEIIGADASPVSRMPHLDLIAKGASGLLVGNFNRSDYRLVRAYYKRALFDILPIADLHMSEVHQLGKMLGVPQNILDQPQLNSSGFNYETLERADKVIGLLALQPTESLNIESYLDEEEDKEFAMMLRKIVEIEYKSRHKENSYIPICYMTEHRLA